MSGGLNEQKRSYRIRNWRADHAALVARGSLTVGFDEDHREQCYAVDRKGQRGAPRRYSELAVPGGLGIREGVHLALRATPGLRRSGLDRLGVEFATPDHRSFSRRAAALTVRIGQRATLRPRPLVIASTGLQVDGEGEGPVRQHGASQRRPWRKLHVAVDAASPAGIAAE